MLLCSSNILLHIHVGVQLEDTDVNESLVLTRSIIFTGTEASRSLCFPLLVACRNYLAYLGVTIIKYI